MPCADLTGISAVFYEHIACDDQCLKHGNKNKVINYSS